MVPANAPPPMVSAQKSASPSMHIERKIDLIDAFLFQSFPKSMLNPDLRSGSSISEYTPFFSCFILL